MDILVKVVTLESGKTLDVGLLSGEAGGDANGFIAALSLTSAGYPDIKAKLGALINSSTGPATEIQKYVTDGIAKTISWTVSSTVTVANGYIYLVYDLVP